MDIISAGPAGGAGAALNAPFGYGHFRDRNRPGESFHARSARAVLRPVRERHAAHIAAPFRVKSQYPLGTDPRSLPSRPEKNVPGAFWSAEQERRARRLVPVYLYIYDSSELWLDR